LILPAIFFNHSTSPDHDILNSISAPQLLHLALPSLVLIAFPHAKQTLDGFFIGIPRLLSVSLYQKGGDRANAF